MKKKCPFCTVRIKKGLDAKGEHAADETCTFDPKYLAYLLQRGVINWGTYKDAMESIHEEELKLN